MLAAIYFPVVRIALHHYALSGKILFQAERAESRDGVGRNVQIPGFSKLALLVSLDQQMSGQDGKGIKDSLCRSVWLSQIEAYRVGVQLCHRERFAVNYEEVALRRVKLLVQIDLESKGHVVGIEWVAIGEAQTLAQFQSKTAAIVGDLPRAGQRRFGLLR